MEKTRIGIIGVGQIGKYHLRNYRDIEGAEIVAACDVDTAELRRVSEDRGLLRIEEAPHCSVSSFISDIADIATFAGFLDENMQEMGDSTLAWRNGCGGLSGHRIADYTELVRARWMRLRKVGA